MYRIDFNTKVAEKNQAAFVIFYATDNSPWHNYEGEVSSRTNLVVPTCLMINRSDGSIGFIGGRVEVGETLEEAARREVKEEVGYTTLEELEEVVAHDIGPITTHAFCCRMPYTQLRQIQSDATQAAHFGSEVTGLFLPHLVDYDTVIGKGGGVVNLLSSTMAPSVREELIHFLINKKVFPPDILATLAQKAGYSLESLLA